MKECKLLDNVGPAGYRKKELKKIINKSILFLFIFLITILPSMAVHDDQNGFPDNSTCIDCHPTYQMMDVTSESSQISMVNSAQVLMSDSLQSFATSNVVGNITLIPSLGQNWYQQGIYGLNSSIDASWGWTFFDENPASEYIIPSEKVIQKNNIYTLLLDDGNNSNPISGANVVANVTYWIYDGTSYTSNIISVQLTEDMNRRGFYSGRFNFYGGTTYKYAGNMCSGCHLSIYGHIGGDSQNGYFPGNYTVLIRAEADSKIVAKDISFEVTPWGCEDCHGSGSQHRRSSLSGIVSGVDLDSACYLCHGVTGIGGHYDAGNPHQNTAHRTINCVDCHTNKGLNSQDFTGVTFENGGINNAAIPQYNYDDISLNGGVHSDLSCEECHGNLLLSNPQGGYKSENYTVNDVINKYDPSFTTIQQFQDYYVINVSGGDPLNIEFNWTGMSNLGFYLYPPNFNPRNFTNLPLYSGSTFTNKPEIYTNNAPSAGKWILQIYGYNLTNSWIGELQSPINDTVSSTYPIEKKDLPTTPECNNCHYSGANGGANTTYDIPDWNPGFAHVDTNGDGTLDIQCRMCHNAMHEITVVTCQNCHTTPPVNHPSIDFNNYNPNQCLSCHGDPHEVTGGGGPDCISCHDIGDGALHLVDVTAINFGIHGLLNNKTNNPNEACWGCHQTNGTEPSGMGDRYNTPYICTDCHLESSTDAGIYGAPIVVEHFKNGQDILAVTEVSSNVSSCLSCHQNISEMILTNLDAENGTFDTDGNGVPGGSTNPYHYGRKRTDMRSVVNETNCSYCHQNNSEFDQVFADQSLTDITHDGDKNCYICHREESTDGKIHDSSLLGGGGGACTECHKLGGSGPVVDVTDLGGHINLNTSVGGNNNLTSEDCMACHFANPHGGPDITNTYYCADCHTSIGAYPVKSTIIFTDKLHGENTCIDCHVADGTYHQNDPRGSVANLTYVARYGPGNTTITDCADCHYASNLDDAPFNAPAGGSHIPGNGGACSGSCHTNGQPTMVQTVHNVGVGPGWGNTKPSITVPVFDTAAVSPGTDVTVTATVTAGGQFHYVDGAQYRIMNSTTEVLPWTPMMAVDGDFEGANEDVTTTLNTSLLPLGIYSVEVRGMAAGPVQNSTARYYPMNGDVSSTKSATLTVQQPPGYVNGTVRSGVSTLSGVLVSTTGATDTTGPDGTYSLMVPAGNYIVTASKMPEYYDYTTVSGVDVVSGGTIIQNFDLVIKLTGSISGIVKGGTT